MTLKIEKYFDGNKLTIRLTGRMQEEHLEDLKALVVTPRIFSPRQKSFFSK